MFKLRSKIAILLAVLGQFASMNSNASGKPAIPLLTPEGEVRVLDEHGFIDECLSAIYPDVPSVSRHRFRNFVISRSKKWGLVLRADFKQRDAAHPNVANRVICWRGPGTHLNVLTAIAVEPLKESYE
jgi:hypothetical protein